MDNLEKFKPENLTKEVIDEINLMSSEELKNLENIPGFFLIRDKSTNKPYTGQSTYKNLAVLHRLGFKKRFEVVGVHADTMKNSLFEEVPTQDEFISPELSIIDTDQIDPKPDGENTQNVNALTPGEKNSLQEYTTNPVQESAIPPADFIKPVKEIVEDSKDQEPIQNETPVKEDPKPEAGSEMTPEEKIVKSQPKKAK